MDPRFPIKVWMFACLHIYIRTSLACFSTPFPKTRQHQGGVKEKFPIMKVSLTVDQAS